MHQSDGKKKKELKKKNKRSRKSKTKIFLNNNSNKILNPITKMKKSNKTAKTTLKNNNLQQQ